MNIYEKLANARVELQQRNIKKSGFNQFAGFHYYELADIMPHINEIMAKYKMLGVCSFNEDYATLSIFDSEKEGDVIVIKSPHAEAPIKGCTPIQQLGGEETYQRRYLWVAAFEIVEADTLDATVGKPDKKQTDDDPLGIGGTENKLPPRGDICQSCGTMLTSAQATLAKKYAPQNGGLILCPDCRTKEGK